jgi:asparagine synthase (glutamine-hydrolysing)
MIFASEIKAILEHHIQRKINKRAVSNYLYMGHANFGEDTFFKGIKLLPPAHNALFDLKSRKFTMYRYYEPAHGSNAVSFEEIRHVLERSVKRRLLSDVPISISLSGGVDSSCIAALVTSNTKEKVKAFTTTSAHGLGDETSLVQLFLRRYPQFEMEQSRLSEESFCENYRDIIFHMDEPFARQSSYVRWEIANLCHRHDRKVLLNGEGADEMLGGYLAFTPYYFRDLLRRFLIGRFISEVYYGLAYKELTKYVRSVDGRLMFRTKYLEHKNNEAERNQKLFGIKLKPSLNLKRGVEDVKEHLADLVSESSLPRLLNCNDKMTMANSVEGRAPFLDHEFVDLVFSMDSRDFINKGCRKFPLRQALRGKVPDEILFRRDKDAFRAPIFTYLRGHRLQKRIQEIFRDARTASIFSSTAFLKEYDGFLAKKRSNRVMLLHGLFLEEWARIFEVECS